MPPHRRKQADMADHVMLKTARRVFRVTPELVGERFFVRRTHPVTGRLVLYVTSQYVALLMVEFAEVVLAADSVPAIFAITTDLYIVFTSNISAIQGLRALDFALAVMVERLKYPKIALTVLLISIGSKIFHAELFWPETRQLPAWLSLSITFAILGGGIGYSPIKTRKTPCRAFEADQVRMSSMTAPCTLVSRRSMPLW